MSQGFADTFFHVKCILGMTFALSLESYMHLNAFYNPLLLGFLGFAWAVSGTILGHEGHHGSVGRSPWVTRIYQTASKLEGESSLHWLQFHLVEHHRHPNHAMIDPKKVYQSCRWGSFDSLRHPVNVAIFLLTYGFVNLAMSIREF